MGAKRGGSESGVSRTKPILAGGEQEQEIILVPASKRQLAEVRLAMKSLLPARNVVVQQEKETLPEPGYAYDDRKTTLWAQAISRDDGIDEKGARLTAGGVTSRCEHLELPGVSATVDVAGLVGVAGLVDSASGEVGLSEIIKHQLWRQWSVGADGQWLDLENINALIAPDPYRFSDGLRRTKGNATCVSPVSWWSEASTNIVTLDERTMRECLGLYYLRPVPLAYNGIS